MLLHWYHLLIVSLLNDAILLSKSSLSVEDCSSASVGYTDNENNVDSNEGGASNETDESMQAEAMYTSDDYYENVKSYNEYDLYLSLRKSLQGMSKEMRDLYLRVIRRTLRAIEYSWPSKENRWDTPKDDEWNFKLRLTDQCNQINRNEIPDQPTGNSSQAFNIMDWETVTFPDFNVSAYDIYLERCCLGKVYPKYPNSRNTCCGSFDYDTTREICCDGNLYAPKLGYECCGEKYINLDNEICCFHPTNGPEPKSFPASVRDSQSTRLFIQCCGSELYDARNHMCFMVTSRLSEEVNFRVIKKKYSRTGCCNGKPYDQDVERCNETGNIHTFLSGPPCVFRQAYEQVQKRINLPAASRTFRPQQTHRWTSKALNLSLCGDQVYDQNFQTCCDDEKENGTVKIWSSIKYGACCGTEIYNYYTHQCCNGHIVKEPKNSRYPRCCGKELYEYGRQWCCVGSNTVMFARPGLGNRCCGVDRLVYNTSTHVCCKNRLFEIPNNRYDWWSCCPSNDPAQPDQPYSWSSALCCNGVIHHLANNSRRYYRCCGSELYSARGEIYNRTDCCAGKDAYNSSTHSCCGGIVVEKPSEHADICCGKSAYDPQLQTCCFDPQTGAPLLTYKRSRNEGCCGGKPYNPNKRSCCGSSLISIDENAKSICCGWYNTETKNYSYAIVEKKANARRSFCCGHSTYDPSNEICCSGNVISVLSKNKTCCGRSAYDRSYEICCDGNVISLAHKDMTCCGSNGYFKYSQLCCHGEVYSRSVDGKKKCCGKNVFDVTKEICCHGVPLRVKDVNAAMCCYDKPPEYNYV